MLQLPSFERATRSATKRALVIAIALAASGVANAGGQWSDHVSFRRSEHTSLKVTEPDGFNVTVTTSDGDQVGAVPQVFTVADEDGFLKVTLTAPDGTAWSKKIEVRSGQQTELTVDYKAEQRAGASRTFVGKFAHAGAACGKDYAVTIKAEFLRHSDGVAAGDLQVKSSHVTDVELTSGDYDVRVSKQSQGNWILVATGQVSVGHDGWEAAFGCRGDKLGVYSK